MVVIGLTISLIPLALLILLFTLLYPGLNADSQIAKNAVKVPQGRAHGDVVSTVVLSTANLPIDYGIPGGKKFSSQRLAFVFGEFHHQKPLQVYYLKGSRRLPRQIGLSMHYLCGGAPSGPSPWYSRLVSCLSGR